MADRTVIDIRVARTRRSRNAVVLAQSALSQCEDAYHSRDWPRFARWHKIYLSVRDRDPERGLSFADQEAAAEFAPVLSNAMAGDGKVKKSREVVMRYGRIVLAMMTMALSTPVPAQTLSWSLSDHATVLAAATLPQLAAAPNYVRLFGGTLWHEEVQGIASANGFFYQLSGATELSAGGEPHMLHAGSGIYIARGTKVTFKAVGAEPSVYVQFLLASLAPNESPAFFGLNGHELYRSPNPIVATDQGSYALNLKKVAVPRDAPWDSPHHRSGFAIHMVLSGTGAETVNGITTIRTPGTISYEPSELTYQWSNPGNTPLTYLLFNVNPEDRDAVVADADPGATAR